MTAAAPTVLDRLGIRLLPDGSGGPEPATLLGLALRHNPKRAQLLVSRLLGKHVPTDPRLVRSAGLLLEPSDNAIGAAYMNGLHDAGIPAIVFGVPDVRAEHKRLGIHRDLEEPEA